MPWGRLDDSLYDHPKLDVLGKDRLPAMGLWLLCLSWSNRFLTDGVVPEERIIRLGGTKRLADLLVESGLFEPEHGAYVIHDFFSFNSSREQVENERRRSRERAAVLRANRGGSHAGTTGGSSEEVPRPRTTSPYPTRIGGSLEVRTKPVLIDPQSQTEEESRAAYDAKVIAQTGVKL